MTTATQPATAPPVEPVSSSADGDLVTAQAVAGLLPLHVVAAGWRATWCDREGFTAHPDDTNVRLHGIHTLPLKAVQEVAANGFTDIHTVLTRVPPARSRTAPLGGFLDADGWALLRPVRIDRKMLLVDQVTSDGSRSTEVQRRRDAVLGVVLRILARKMEDELRSSQKGKYLFEAGGLKVKPVADAILGAIEDAEGNTPRGFKTGTLSKMINDALNAMSDEGIKPSLS